MFLAGWLVGKYVIHLENELMKRVKKVFCVVMGCIRISFESTKNAVPQTPEIQNFIGWYGPNRNYAVLALEESGSFLRYIYVMF